MAKVTVEKTLDGRIRVTLDAPRGDSAVTLTPSGALLSVDLTPAEAVDVANLIGCAATGRAVPKARTA